MLWAWALETTQSNARGTSGAKAIPDRRYQALHLNLGGGRPVHTAARQHQTLKYPALAYLETYHFL